MFSYNRQIQHPLDQLLDSPMKRLLHEQWQNQMIDACLFSFSTFYLAIHYYRLCRKSFCLQYIPQTAVDDASCMLHSFYTVDPQDNC